jgi:hypothetical protein
LSRFPTKGIVKFAGADSVSPMNSTTAVGTVQIFTAVYSDFDGWQNIAAATEA